MAIHGVQAKTGVDLFSENSRNGTVRSQGASEPLFNYQAQNRNSDAFVKDEKLVKSFVTKSWGTEVKMFKDSGGNITLKIDYDNNDPDEFPEEEIVIGSDGELKSYTETVYGSGSRNRPDSRFKTKHIFDENGYETKIIESEYDSDGHLVSKKEKPASGMNVGDILKKFGGTMDSEIHKIVNDNLKESAYYTAQKQKKVFTVIPGEEIINGTTEK